MNSILALPRLSFCFQVLLLTAMQRTAEADPDAGVLGTAPPGAGERNASTAAAAAGTRPSPPDRRPANPAAGDPLNPGAGDSGEPVAAPLLPLPEDARSLSSCAATGEPGTTPDGELPGRRSSN